MYARAKKPYSSPEVLKVTARRWEKNGTMQADLAQHLAEVLQITVAILQGSLPAPAPSKVDEMEVRLRKLIAGGSNPRLAEELANFEDEENQARALAMRICSRLEIAQLSQAQEEFQDLAAITGYSMKELLEPTSFQGFWMLIGTGPLGPARTEILAGVSDVLYKVRTEMQSCLEGLHQSDAHVTFAEEKHWFRVTIHDPRHPRLTRSLRFVRCQPKESGLQWSSPTWQDRYWVEALPNDACEYANFVTGFDSLRLPSDCRNLRFAVTKTPTLKDFEERGPDAPPEIVELTVGDLAELPAETLESFRREGNAHALVISWLAADLWDRLLPLMSDWPLECWSFRAAHSRIDILLNVPYRLYANSKAPLHFGHRFSVMLYEIDADGGQKRAPWRQKNVAYVHERLTKALLQARQEQVPSA
nr:hypothetical protein [uncultured Rhodoferax sp.]